MKRAAYLLAAALPSCGGSSPTQPPPVPSTTVAAQPSPSPSPSASPAANSCPWGPFAPGPVTRLAISPRALESDGARAPMRTTLPGDEIARLCRCVWIGNGGYEPGSCQR